MINYMSHGIGEAGAMAHQLSELDSQAGEYVSDSFGSGVGISAGVPCHERPQHMSRYVRCPPPSPSEINK